VGIILVKTLGSTQHKALVAALIAKREAVGMTQTELAAALGEYQSFVARLESGQRRVDVIELIQLARILRFDAPVLVREVEQVKET
jgi:transcriptional regulator with XRE-family HTH domain